MEIEQLEMLRYSWTAVVQLNNGLIFPIWCSAWPSIKHIVRTVISVSSDYPKYEIE